MTVLRSLRRIGGIALASGAAMTLAAPALAATSCGPVAVMIGAADVAFVGTMTVVDPAGARATFAVEEVWKGGDLPANVEVTHPFGLPWTDPSAAGARYLVIANVVGGALQVEGGCNQAYPWDPSLAAARPSTAHPPQSPAPSGDVPLPLLLIAGSVLLLGVVSAIAFRRTRRADR